MRVPVRVTPGPVLAGHGQFGLQKLVVPLEIAVLDGPVGTDAVICERAEIRRMEAGRIAREMHHGASDAPPRVVAAEFDGMRARDDARLVPVQLVRSSLVTDPVLVGIPERPCVEDHHAPPLPGQSLRQDGASGSAPDDHNVDLFVMPIATHIAA